MKTLAHIKLDIEVKEQAQRLAGKLGFSLSTLINAQLKQLIYKQEVNFKVWPEEQMSPELEKQLEKINLKDKKNLIGPFSTPEELDQFFKSTC
jgi:addiction module RelB/DinJ family antitoxin